MLNITTNITVENVLEECTLCLRLFIAVICYDQTSRDNIWTNQMHTQTIAEAFEYWFSSNGIYHLPRILTR